MLGSNESIEKKTSLDFHQQSCRSVGVAVPYAEFHGTVEVVEELGLLAELAVL